MTVLLLLLKHSPSEYTIMLGISIELKIGICNFVLLVKLASTLMLCTHIHVDGI